MKTILNQLRYFLTTIALAVLAVGCASGNLLDRENVAAAAGFKVITPSKPDQEALLRKLPADKVTQITHGGKPYYILPDLKNNQAYVGGPKQYQAYQALRRTQLENSKNYKGPPDVHMIEIHTMTWSEWGGWSAVVGTDGTGQPDWY